MNIHHRWLAALLLTGMVASAKAASCSVTVSDLQFPAYIANQRAPADANGTVHVRCQNPMAGEVVSFAVTLGRSTGGGQQTRVLQSGADTLQYNVYIDAARLRVWGDGNEGTSVGPGLLNLPAQSSADLVLYGRLFARQNAAPGLYGDSLLVTVSY